MRENFLNVVLLIFGNRTTRQTELHEILDNKIMWEAYDNKGAKDVL